jgi:ADP-heptose:LPS heptosyltransferase
VAHALGKKTISLFGPTNSNEIYIDNGIKIQKESMKQISPDEVMKAIEKLM